MIPEVSHEHHLVLELDPSYGTALKPLLALRVFSVGDQFNFLLFPGRG